ncbi:MAG: hypothetical protein ABEI53_02700 [Candidatus Magasanikbacteria bacterium]
MDLDESEVRQLIPNETLEIIPEGYEEEVFDAVASGNSPAGAVGAIFHYEMGLTQREAAEEAGVSKVTIRNNGEFLGYTGDDSAEVEGYKALVPDKFRSVIDNHIDSGGKAKTYTAGIYAALTDNTPEEAAEVFKASKDHVAKNASRAESFLEAEEIAGEEFQQELYKTTDPIKYAKAVDRLDGRFADKVFSSERPGKTAEAIEFFISPEGITDRETTFIPEREIRDLIYGEDGIGARKTAEILSERVPEEYQEELMSLTEEGKDPRMVSAVILENETDMGHREVQRTSGAGTFEIKRNREEIEELLGF